MYVCWYEYWYGWYREWKVMYGYGIYRQCCRYWYMNMSMHRNRNGYTHM